MKKSLPALFVFALLMMTGNVLFAQRIAVTIAGTGAPGNSGDGASGLQAAIGGLKDVCIDAAQNLYFTDQVNGLIREVSTTTGVIATIAGGGASLADEVPATSASLSPKYLCVSNSGMLYVTTGNEIRKINLLTHTITTVAGSATAGFGGDGGPASAATLNNPEGICIDAAGNLYFADRWNNRVRKITAATGIISTFAGNGTPTYGGDGSPATAANLSSPIAVCLNTAGDLFVSDQEPDYPDVLDQSYIRKVSAGTGIIATVAGSATYGATYGVPATTAELGTITGMCVDDSGNVYCNEMSCSCRELDMASGYLNLVAGNFGSESFTDDTDCTLSNMSYPMGICMDKAGNVYIADSANNRIRKFISVQENKPVFVFGPGQFMNPVTGSVTPLDTFFWAVDLIGMEDTWTVASAPTHGTLTGFPATANASGSLTPAKPSGLGYTPYSSYAGEDEFRVRVTNSNLKSDTITIYVGSASLTQSVHNTVAASAGINIYPNPATSVLNIQWTNVQTANANVAITDVMGREVYNVALPGSGSIKGSMPIDISAIPPGMYFVKVAGTDERKFVKQ